MSNKDILEKAIQKAIDGGWDFFGKLPKGGHIWFDSPLINRWDVRNKNGKCIYNSLERSDGGLEIIYNHDFAKALWGKETIEHYVVVYGSNEIVKATSWEYNLQQMVISEDPIKYLGDNI